MADVVLRRAVERMDAGQDVHEQHHRQDARGRPGRADRGHRPPGARRGDRLLPPGPCRDAPGSSGMVDTKHLEWFYASEPLLAELLATGRCEVAGPLAPIGVRRRGTLHRPPADLMTGRPAGALPWQPFLDGLSPARRGALIYIAAGLVFVATDSLTKSLVAEHPGRARGVRPARHVPPRGAAHRRRPTPAAGCSRRNARGRSSRAASRCSCATATYFLAAVAAAPRGGQRARLDGAADGRRARRARCSASA